MLNLGGGEWNENGNDVLLRLAHQKHKLHQTDEANGIDLVDQLAHDEQQQLPLNEKIQAIDQTATEAHLHASEAEPPYSRGGQPRCTNRRPRKGEACLKARTRVMVLRNRAV